MSWIFQILKIRILLEAHFWKFDHPYTFPGSREVPQKIWVQSVQQFCVYSVLAEGPSVAREKKKIKKKIWTKNVFNNYNVLASVTPRLPMFVHRKCQSRNIFIRTFCKHMTSPLTHVINTEELSTVNGIFYNI